MSIRICNDTCDCDPQLGPYTVKCIINYQAVQRLPNCWISSNTGDNSAKYYVANNCPASYCSQMASLINVTGPDKTGLIALFCISRNTIFNIECTVLLWWLDTVTPDILYNKCSYIAIIS